MTEPTETTREAVERNAKALAAGQFAVVMADVTPQALAQLMQLAGQAGAMAPGAMPADATYRIEERGAVADGERFDVTFESAAGAVSLATTWSLILGRWKVAGIELLSAEIAGDEGSGTGVQGG